MPLLNILGNEQYEMPAPQSYFLGETDRGLILVLSYRKFQDKYLNLPSNAMDVLTIKKTFGDLGFKVIVFDDKTVHETHKILNQASKNPEYKMYNCFVLIVLSHGEENGFLCHDGKVIKYANMYEYFHEKDCPLFAGKPKLFFIQACLEYKSACGFDCKKTFDFKFGKDTFTHSNKPDCELYPNPINIIMKNSSVTNLIINVGTANIRDVQMIANNSTGVDYQAISESLPTLQIASACNICDVQLITKRLRFECCDHLKFCLKCGVDVLKDCPKCINCPSTSKQIFCILCQNQMSTKRIQFECCGHLKFCFKCASTSMKDCPKCANETKNILKRKQSEK